MTTAAAARRARAQIVQRAEQATSAADLFAATSPLLRAIVPFDAAAWHGTDPGTGLPTSPSLIEDMDGVPEGTCSAYWHNELLADDVHLYRHLARRERPAGALLESIAAAPSQSSRYRLFFPSNGFHDELRAVLRVGGAVWGLITLMRREEAPPFSERETALMADLSAPLGEALRRHARPNEVYPEPADRDRPGQFLFDADANLILANEEAATWLAELPAEGPFEGVDSAHGFLPLWLLITVYRASAIRHGVGDGTARVQVRSRRGRWLTCHASCLRQADGTVGPVSVIVEPAQPSAIAPIVVQAYDLTDREQQIVRLIARGATTTEIADELFLSPHTVRDHVKAVFAKVEVSSRGELTAKLFADFYFPAREATHITTN